MSSVSVLFFVSVGESFFTLCFRRKLNKLDADTSTLALHLRALVMVKEYSPIRAIENILKKKPTSLLFHSWFSFHWE